MEPFFKTYGYSNSGMLLSSLKSQAMLGRLLQSLPSTIDRILNSVSSLKRRQRCSEIQGRSLIASKIVTALNGAWSFASVPKHFSSISENAENSLECSEVFRHDGPSSKIRSLSSENLRNIYSPISTRKMLRTALSALRSFGMTVTLFAWQEPDVSEMEVLAPFGGRTFSWFVQRPFSESGQDYRTK